MSQQPAIQKTKLAVWHAGNYSLPWYEQSSDPGWTVLTALTALSRLDLSQCRLLALPPTITALSSLEALNIAENRRYEEAGSSGFTKYLSVLDPLTGLGRLSSLHQAGYGLQLEAALWGMPALRVGALHTCCSHSLEVQQAVAT